MQSWNVAFDRIRVVAAFAIVWLHVSSGVVVHKPDAQRLEWWVGNLADALSRWALPVFVMLSGALLLTARAHKAPGRFYRRRLARILVPLLFWTAFYLGWTRYTNGTLDPAAATQSVLAGSPYIHLWYLYMLLGLYAVTPLLSFLVERSPHRLLLLIVVLAFVIVVVRPNVGGVFGNTFLGLWIPFVPYFLAGRYQIGEARFQYLRLLGVMAALVCGVGVAIEAGVAVSQARAGGIDAAYSHFNPLVIVMTLGMFAVLGPGASAVAQDDWHARVVRQLAPLTLGVYVVHPAWLEIFAKHGVHGAWVHPAVGIPAVTIVSFAISLATTWGIRQVPLLRRVV